MEENNKNKKNIKKKKVKEEKIDPEIEKAKKEMDELMKSISDEMGMKNVKVVQIQVPKANFKNFFMGLIISLVLNSLLIIGTSGFIDFLNWEAVFDLLLFAIYFSVVEKVIEFLFLKFFTPLIIKTMGLASFIPIIISLAIVLIFPVFVQINEPFLAILILIFIYACKRTISNYITNKFLINKIRRKKWYKKL